jgi:acetyl/propionyl-CoA carboxylase alpha subunit
MKIKSSVNSQPIAFSAHEKNPLNINGNSDESIRIIESISDNHLIIERKNRKFDVRLLILDTVKKVAQIKVDGYRFEVKQEDEYDALLKTLGMGAGVVKKVNDMKAPMPGVVLDIKVIIGQEIKKDDPIVVLEAMKMENLLKSPIDGVIKGVSISKGETVEKNRVLVTFE